MKGDAASKCPFQNETTMMASYWSGLQSHVQLYRLPLLKAADSLASAMLRVHSEMASKIIMG